MTSQPLEVLVVGAGIAGLSAAIALGKQGHLVVVNIRSALGVWSMLIRAIVVLGIGKSPFLKKAGAAISPPPPPTAWHYWNGWEQVRLLSKVLYSKRLVRLKLADIWLTHRFIQMTRYGPEGDLKYQEDFEGIHCMWQGVGDPLTT